MKCRNTAIQSKWLELLVSVQVGGASRFRATTESNYGKRTSLPAAFCQSVQPELFHWTAQGMSHPQSNSACLSTSHSAMSELGKKDSKMYFLTPSVLIALIKSPWEQITRTALCIAQIKGVLGTLYNENFRTCVCKTSALPKRHISFHVWREGGLFR